MKKYSGLIDFWGKRMLYFWLIVFVLMGFFVYKFLPGGIGSGTLVIGWGLLLMFLLLLNDIPLINFYLISKDKIICIRGGFPGFFRFDKIADIRKIQWSDLKKLTDQEWIKMTLVRYYNSKYNKNYTREHLNEIIPTLKGAFRYSRLQSYCTAAPTIKVTRGKAETLIKKSDYILITMINGKQYVISPKEVNNFISSLSNKIKN